MANKYELNDESELLRDGKVCAEVGDDGTLEVRRGYERFRPEMEEYLNEPDAAEEQPEESTLEEEMEYLAKHGQPADEPRTAPKAVESLSVAIFDERTGTVRAYREENGTIIIPAGGDQVLRAAVEELLGVEPPEPKKGDPQPPADPELGDRAPRFVAWARVNWPAQRFNDNYRGRPGADGKPITPER